MSQSKAKKIAEAKANLLKARDLVVEAERVLAELLSTELISK